MRLEGRQRAELMSLRKSPGLWSRVEPHNCDDDLAFYLRHGLVRHLGEGKGYEITHAGRRALGQDGGAE